MELMNRGEHKNSPKLTFAAPVSQFVVLWCPKIPPASCTRYRVLGTQCTLSASSANKNKIYVKNANLISGCGIHFHDLFPINHDFSSWKFKDSRRACVNSITKEKERVKMARVWH
jgi:hypothetical protein